MSSKTLFRCGQCGYGSSKWMGFCPQCGHNEPLTEAVRPIKNPTQAAVGQSLAVSAVGPQRVPSNWTEFDRVLGGGLVPGSMILIGGEPGVGKSTLLLQVAGSLAEAGNPVVVASAEESPQQVVMRARRLGIDSENITLVADEDVDSIIAYGAAANPKVLIVDSIQTVSVSELGSGPGSVAQVREAAARLMRFAKTSGVTVVLVGHVTKDGNLAGPKMLEHMVDVVLYLEGDPDRGFRVLRTTKNRFGPTHVSGMFDMAGDGLIPIEDPSKAFLEGWDPQVPGTVVYPAVEGRRSVLVEIQALIVPSRHPQPRRSIRGLDATRVNQVLAVLERHGGMKLQDSEVYVNVVGGWRINEPGADLPVALAVASSAQGLALNRIASWGEIGLAGEVRSIPFETRRREEVSRMGLEGLVAPPEGGSMRLSEALSEAGIPLVVHGLSSG